MRKTELQSGYWEVSKLLYFNVFNKHLFVFPPLFFKLSYIFSHILYSLLLNETNFHKWCNLSWQSAREKQSQRRCTTYENYKHINHHGYFCMRMENNAYNILVCLAMGNRSINRIFFCEYESIQAHFMSYWHCCMYLVHQVHLHRVCVCLWERVCANKRKASMIELHAAGPVSLQKTANEEYTSVISRQTFIICWSCQTVIRAHCRQLKRRLRP